MTQQSSPASVPGHKVRFFVLADADELAAYYLRNEEFHREWSPIQPPVFFSAEFQRERLRMANHLRDEGREYRFGIFAEQPYGKVIGTISLSAVERGVFQNGRLGYSVDAGYERRGVMTSSLREVMRFAFKELNLHRLEANLMPRNIASRRVMEKCGFTKVGFSPKMVMINGVWEDHDMYMMLVDDFSHIS